LLWQLVLSCSLLLMARRQAPRYKGESPIRLWKLKPDDSILDW
jgi:hypothetical protein